VGWAVGPIVVAAGVGLVLRPHLAPADLAMLMLLGVVVVAARNPRWIGVLGTVLAIVGYDLLFITPYYRFSVSDTAYLITFVVMLIVGLAIGHLTSLLREAAQHRAQRERIASTRLVLNERLGAVASADELAEVTAAVLTEATGASCRVCWVARGTTVEAVIDGLGQPRIDHGLRDGVLAILEGSLPHYLTVDGWLVHRIQEGERLWGVVTLDPGEPPRALLDQVPFLAAVLGQVGTILERRETAAAHEAVRVEVEAGRLRTALLSTVSHDLRTPLTTIEGSASTLLTGQDAIPQATRAALLEAIQDESRRMNRLIGNLLEMVRVETGALPVRRSWQPIEEVIGVALLRVEPRLAGRAVEVDLPEDLPLVAIDELLMEHVVTNILENAARHAPGETPIRISARATEESLEIRVRDHGPGLPDAVLAAGSSATVPRGRPIGPGAGHGLGLLICRGIVSVHGGTLTLANAPDGGAELTVRLPRGVAPDGPAHEEEVTA